MGISCNKDGEMINRLSPAKSFSPVRKTYTHIRPLGTDVLKVPLLHRSKTERNTKATNEMLFCISLSSF